jgi:hypothetical protein
VIELATFLTQLRAILADPTCWHPVGCANERGRILGEYEQSVPYGLPGAPIENIPVAWNLRCAITYLLQWWEFEGRFLDVPVQKTALRYAAYGVLGDALETQEHHVALAAIDAVLAEFAEASAA